MAWWWLVGVMSRVAVWVEQAAWAHARGGRSEEQQVAGLTVTFQRGTLVGFSGGFDEVKGFQMEAKTVRPSAPPSSVEVLAFQRIGTTNDVNGNPRRHYALYSHAGLTIATIEEGYHGRGQVQYLYEAGVVELPSITVSPSELKHFLGAAKTRGGNF